MSIARWTSQTVQRTMRRAMRLFSPILTREEEKSNVQVGLFKAGNPDHMKTLKAIIQAGIIEKDKENQNLKPQFAQMVEWLTLYVSSPDFLKLYSDKNTLEFVAEAAFWTVFLGLDKHLAKMSYADIRKFQPLAESFKCDTERSRLIKEVSEKLQKPAWSYEASFALGQAAWCVYVHVNSFEKLEKEVSLYESQNVTTLRSKL